MSYNVWYFLTFFFLFFYWHDYGEIKILLHTCAIWKLKKRTYIHTYILTTYKSTYRQYDVIYHNTCAADADAFWQSAHALCRFLWASGGLGNAGNEVIPEDHLARFGVYVSGWRRHSRGKVPVVSVLISVGLPPVTRHRFANRIGVSVITKRPFLSTRTVVKHQDTTNCIPRERIFGQIQHALSEVLQ